MVTQIRNRDAIRRTALPECEYTCIDSETVARPAWKIATFLSPGKGKAWTLKTAINTLTYPYFERLVWKEFGPRIRGGEYDLVHRITPLSPTTPSFLAGKCARAGIPFLLGPINGGVPWPPGFDRERRREHEWLSYVREAYRLLPGYRSTRNHARAIIVGSRDTLEQIAPRYREKCVYIPENGVDPARFSRERRRTARLPLRIAFVGRLVPYKGADMLLEAAAPLVKQGRAQIEIIGDGPERSRLEGMVEREGLTGAVALTGWIPHASVEDHLVKADVFGFPSVREFGGGVILEAMALGVVPVVIDYGGPGELVTDDCGVRIPIGSRASIVSRLRSELTRLCDNLERLEPMSEGARRRICEYFHWDKKAAQIVEIYEWALDTKRPKPDFGFPLGT
jgi:glycosyltransferase involved in cell wall biosynthesis